MLYFQQYRTFQILYVPCGYHRIPLRHCQYLIPLVLEPENAITSTLSRDGWGRQAAHPER